MLPVRESSATNSTGPAIILNPSTSLYWMVCTVIPSRKIELGFPHDLLAAEYMKDTTYGGTYSIGKARFTWN
jgi:hypothetical protein